MADTTKLAGTFVAGRLTIGVRPHNLDRALECVRDLGLFPDVCGSQDGYVLFRVFVPLVNDGRRPLHVPYALTKAVDAFHGALFHSVERNLICPIHAEE